MLEAADLALDYPDFHARYTLSVPAGALCGLIGPSGGGKTTLLHAIAGFEIAERPGVLRFAGRDLIPLQPAERPLSILFQDHNLFPHLTAFENVGLGIDPRLRLDEAGRERVEDGACAGRPDGARGSAVRRSFPAASASASPSPARWCASKPLMLLDEPFGGLDPGLRKEMIALVDRLRRDEGLTVLVSIHTPEELGATADLMAFIADGRVVAVAPPEEMLRAAGRSGNRRAISADEDAYGWRSRRSPYSDA